MYVHRFITFVLQDWEERYISRDYQKVIEKDSVIEQVSIYDLKPYLQQLLTCMHLHTNAKRKMTLEEGSPENLHLKI